MFQVFYLDKVTAYFKYYFLLKKTKEENKEDIIFLVLQDEKTQEINLLIEISDIISVNYLHKYTGAQTIKDDELILILDYISILFKINTTIIHPVYKKYTNKTISNKITIPKINIDEYNDEDELMNFSADLTTYNNDIWNYLKNIEKSRFKNTENVIHKMNLSSLDRLKRLSPDLILKIEDILVK